MMFTKKYYPILIFIFLFACNNNLECNLGEFRYEGRPSRSLFSYNKNCHPKCFSNPMENSCEESCEPIKVDTPPAFLVDDRLLILVDNHNIDDGKALVYTFGYDDLTPEHWNFVDAQNQIYMDGQTFGHGTFRAYTYVVDLSSECTDNTNNCVESYFITHTNFLRPSPARLEIQQIDTQKGLIKGHISLAFKNQSNQIQNQVIGCFYLPMEQKNENGIRILSQ